MKSLCIFFAFASPLFLSAQPIEATSDAWAGIVNINAASLTPNYREPWNGGRPGGGSGTGFYIGENRFLTNAHVVSNAAKLVVRFSNDPQPREARIVHIAHDCDLAMIEVVDKRVTEKLTPLEIGEMPKLNTEVIAVGFPIGGSRVSVTRGVVSRIDFNAYSHSATDSHLVIQIDAAINPGNSGGPVLQDGKVVGVAFQGLFGGAQNVGYMIPIPVVKRFLADIEDGSYDRYVDLAVSDFPIENRAQRKALGLKDDGIGVMVGSVSAAGSAADLLQPGDVILGVDGHEVFSNGLVRVDGELVNMNEIVERKFAGDTIRVDFLRNKEKMEGVIQLQTFQPALRLGNSYDQRPRYVVYAGLVFQPLERNLIEAHRIQKPLIKYMFDNFLSDAIYEERPEPVILTTVLPDEVNTHATAYAQSVVDEINGVKINGLDDVQGALATKTGDGSFVVIKCLEMSRPLVLKRESALLANPRVRRTYNISEEFYLGEKKES